MDNNILSGLTISLVGVVIAFSFMAVFILIMVVLQKLFPAKSAATEQQAVEVSETPALVVENADDPGVVAAIAAAIGYARAKSQSQLGSALQFGSGSWWTSHRSAARQDSDLIKR